MQRVALYVAVRPINEQGEVWRLIDRVAFFMMIEMSPWSEWLMKEKSGGGWSDTTCRLLGLRGLGKV